MSLVEFVHVTKRYKKFEAVSDLSFRIEGNEAVGLVGESGCGKTTTASLLLGLLEPSEGEILWNGEKQNQFNKAAWKQFRRQAQMVFQDTAASLNPRLTVFDSLAEPIRNYESCSRSELRERIGGLLADVGLSPSCMDQYPRSFSGGQRQRIAIARALALQPRLLILDEATSNLDVSIQAQILNLLLDLKERYGLSYLVISHDLGVIKYLCDWVLVMKDGKVVEELDSEDLEKACHPYTRLLLSSVPAIQNGASQRKTLLP